MSGDAERALLELGRALSALGYRFSTVTPETQRRVLARDTRLASTLRDVFGWNRPFQPELLAPELLSLALAAGAVREEADAFRATVRFSSFGPRLFVHSSYPTQESDAVFFGPDTHRFCAFVARSLGRVGRLVDIGCGSGAGGISAAPSAERVTLSDVNARALGFARVNAALAGVTAEVLESDVLSGISGPIDAIIANPPYMLDARHRTYRDGGGAFGEALALRILRESLQRLRSGGRLLLYTGSAIVDGCDVVREHAEAICRESEVEWQYEELDPDVFGEQLSEAGYEQVERIAAVALRVVLR